MKNVSLHPAPKPRGIAVFEQRPWWAPELQRHFRNEPVSVRGCQSAAEAFQADVAVLHFDAAPAAVLQGLASLAAAGTDPGVIVVAGSGRSDLEWMLRELGADAFVDEQINGADLARLCRRLLERVREQTWLMPV